MKLPLYLLAWVVTLCVPGLAQAAIPTSTALGLGIVNTVDGDVTLDFEVSACAPEGSPFESGMIEIFDGANPVYSFTLSFLLAGGAHNDGPCADGLVFSNGPIPIALPPHPTLLGVSPGAHTYTAVYSGDALYETSTSTPIAVTVPPRSGPIATSTTLGLIGTNPITGDVNLDFRVSGCGPNEPLFESGTIVIYEGATPVHSFTLSSFATGGASFGDPCDGGAIISNGPPPYEFVISPTLPAVSPGTHTYTAVYSGDAFYGTSASQPVSVDVTQLPTVSSGDLFSGPTATLTGDATLHVTGGGASCGFTHAAFVPVSGSPYSPPDSVPSGVAFPNGLVSFITSGCTPGATLTFTLTLPRGTPGAGSYWKYGPTRDKLAPHWYQLPVTVRDNVVTFSIIDGGLGDDDMTANGSIVDPGGLGVGSQPIPTLSQSTLVLLGLLFALIGLRAVARPAYRSSDTP